MSNGGPKPPSDPPDPDGGENPGEALFRQNLQTIERAIRIICGRHRLSPDEAEDFASHARLKLMDNSYAVLRKFRGLSSLQTFLGVAIGHFFQDYRNAAWGKWRSSAEAVRLGSPAPLIEQLTVRDGHTPDEAFEILTTNYSFDISRARFEAIVARLPTRVKRRFDGDDALVDLPSPDSADQNVKDEEERQATLRLHQALHEELSALAPDDRLLLRLSDEDGLPMRAIAEIMGAEAAVLYRRRDRIRAEVRKRLKKRGFGREGDPE